MRLAGYAKTRIFLEKPAGRVLRAGFRVLRFFPGLILLLHKMPPRPWLFANLEAYQRQTNEDLQAHLSTLHLILTLPLGSSLFLGKHILTFW